MTQLVPSGETGQGRPSGGRRVRKRRFSRKGDSGYTSLLGTKTDPIGKYRVPKYHPQPETYGVLDEVNAVLSMARHCAESARTRDIVFGIQQDLHMLMAELATAPEAYAASGYKIDQGHVQRLEGLLVSLQDEVELPSRFVTSAACFSAAVLDLARSVLRRAERWAARLSHDKIIENDSVTSYINRCADLLWTLARYEEAANQRSGGAREAGRLRQS